MFHRRYHTALRAVLCLSLGMGMTLGVPAIASRPDVGPRPVVGKRAGDRDRGILGDSAKLFGLGLGSWSRFRDRRRRP